jgi:hypothetical protein
VNIDHATEQLCMTIGRRWADREPMTIPTQREMDEMIAKRVVRDIDELLTETWENFGRFPGPRWFGIDYARTFSNEEFNRQYMVQPRSLRIPGVDRCQCFWCSQRPVAAPPRSCSMPAGRSTPWFDKQALEEAARIDLASYEALAKGPRRSLILGPLLEERNMEGTWTVTKQVEVSRKWFEGRAWNPDRGRWETKKSDHPLIEAPELENDHFLQRFSKVI